MCATAAHLIDDVLREVALRKWVLTRKVSNGYAVLAKATVGSTVRISDGVAWRLPYQSASSGDPDFCAVMEGVGATAKHVYVVEAVAKQMRLRRYEIATLPPGAPTD